jgi:hypothetical protein
MSLAIELPAAIAISEEVVFRLTEVAVADCEPGAVGESEEQAATPRTRAATTVRFRNDSGLNDSGLNDSGLNDSGLIVMHSILPP